MIFKMASLSLLQQLLLLSLSILSTTTTTTTMYTLFVVDAAVSTDSTSTTVRTTNNNMMMMMTRSRSDPIFTTNNQRLSSMLVLRGGGGNRDSSRSVVRQPPPPTPPDGTVDHASHVINLIKTIIGAGVLGIPAGMTASFVGVKGRKVVVVRGMILLITIGLFAANGFNTIGQVCRATNSPSYAQAWNATVSSSTTIIPNIACIMVTLCTLITYSMVLADTIPLLLRPIVGQLQAFGGGNLSLLPYISRTNILVLITIAILLPLCLLQSLSALAPFSLMGICGMIYTAIVMTIRWFDRSYSINGRFVSTIEPKLRPNFDMSGSSGGGGGSNVAILISMLSTAYMAHYNAPKFYWELQNRSASKYSAVVYQSFIGAITIMIVIASMGYLTFGTNSQSLILNNYSTSDQFMSLSRWAVVLSLIFSYPLAFVGVRDGIYNLLQINPQSGNVNQNRRKNQMTTIIVLGIITFIAAIMKDIRIILSLGGATFGNLLSYVFPAFLIVGLANKKKIKQIVVATTNDNKEDLFPTPNQVQFAILTAILGVMMGIVGTIKAIQAM